MKGSFVFALVALSSSACLLPPLPNQAGKKPQIARANDVQGPELPPDPRTDGRLPTTVHPLKYELEFDIDPRESRFSGRTTIDVSVPRVTSIVVLHAGDFFVRSITARVGSDVIV